MNNNATDGGVFLIGFLKGELYLLDSNYTGNYAIEDGGAIRVDSRATDNSVVSLYNSTFESNRAGASGGAMFIEGNVVVQCSQLKFISNDAAIFGGAIMT